MKETCGGCRFFELRLDWLFDGESPEPDDDRLRSLAGLGRCRRYPPKWSHNTDEAVIGFGSFDGNATDFYRFPVLQDYEWCGEWRAKG